MIVSSRSTLFPGVALAAVGAVAAGSIFVAPPAMTLPRAEVHVPVVHIEDIQLAGLGRDAYNSVSASVQGLVKWASWGVGIVPFIGGIISDQLDLVYFGLIQPLIANTVYAVSDIIANPLGLLTTVGLYVNNQIYVGYTWLTSEINAFGLPPILGPLPPPAPLASTGGSSTRIAGARSVRPRAAAVATLPAQADTGVRFSARANRGERLLATGSAAVAGTQVADGAAASVRAVQDAPGEVRSVARATRGALARATTQARPAANAVASIAD